MQDNLSYFNEGVPPIEQHPLQIRQRPVQKAQSQKKHCHRRTTEHEPNRVANSSSPKRAMETASVSLMRNINMPSFPSLMVQRYEEKLVLYQLFHKILGIIPIFRGKT